MRFHFKTALSPKVRFLFSFLGGLFAGIIYGWLFAPGYMEQVGFLSDAFLLNYLKRDIDGNHLFGYLFKGRSISLFFVWILGSSFLGGALIYLVLLWSGFSVGLYLMAGLVKRGISGLGFCIAAVFPQMLFYIPAFGLVLIQAFVLSGKREMGKERVLRYGIILFVSFLLLFMGVLMESYVNPAILKKLLKIF